MGPVSRALFLKYVGLLMSYSYDEAYDLAMVYFGGDELASKVFLDKYALRNFEGNLLEATPDDMHRRIAREIARVEADKFASPFSEEEVLAYISRFARIIPQGSPMYGIGNTYQYSTLSNCYVVDSPLDSYGAILKADQELVQISKRRGGVGIDVSNIRPAKTRTNNAARSSTGVVPFMQRFSNSIREVGQDGRRGALMLTISVHHPEVVDFATAKTDSTRVTGANISIRLSDEFLSAVKEGREYEQRWPVEGAPKVRRKVDARTVWRKIIETAHATAEPGLLFWDSIKSESPADCYEAFQTVSTNPCCFSVSDDVWVMTEKGIREIKTLSQGDKVWVDDMATWAETSGYFKAGISPVYKVTLSNGEEFRVTENHKFQGVRGRREGGRIIHDRRELVPVSELSEGDLIACSVAEPPHGAFGAKGTFEEGIILGWLSGDGCLSYHQTDDAFPSVFLDFWEDEHDTAEFVGEAMKSMGYFAGVQNHSRANKKRIHSSIFTEDFTRNHEMSIWRFKTGHNPFLYEASREFVAGYLSAYFTADKTVTCSSSNKNAIRVCSIDRDRLVQVKHLLTCFGIRSAIGVAKQAGKSTFHGKDYSTQTLYRITITGRTNLRKFADAIGFISDRKQSRLQEILEKDYQGAEKMAGWAKIVSIEPDGIEEVGCVEVPGYHRFTANGIVSGNSELPLSPNDSCRLLLLNLFTYVVNPFTQDAYFDYDRFYEDSRVAQRFMDDIVDLEIEAIDRIIEKVKGDPEPDAIKAVEIELWNKIRTACVDGRRTGTGITALGDTLAALGIRYGSDESIEVTERIYKTLKLGCYRASVDLAMELGPFPSWSPEKEEDNPFLNRIADEDPELSRDMQSYGRRNIAILTTAPAGSVSIQTQTSSGIEPVFMLSYTRRKKVNPSDQGTRVDFVDPSGDRWQEFTVYHPKFKMWMDVTGKSDPAESPYHGATAEEIDWKQRVRLQAAANRHVDHALSSTLNLPEDVTVEKVAEIYETAWEAGCKGITVYRKNCRTGVLVEKKPDVPKITKTEAIKRPKSLACDIYHPICGGKKYFVVVSHLHTEPYEVLAGEFSLPKAASKGICVKAGKGVYQLLDADGNLLDENVADYCEDDQEALLRMVSTSLRHGADIKHVVGQLEKVRGSLYSFAKCLSRVLKKYIPDGTEVKGETCRECGQESLVRSEGCVQCKGCGWSKC